MCLSYCRQKQLPVVPDTRVTVRLDFDTSKVTFLVNNKEQYIVNVSGIPAGEMYPCIGMQSIGEQVQLLDLPAWRPFKEYDPVQDAPEDPETAILHSAGTDFKMWPAYGVRVIRRGDLPISSVKAVGSLGYLHIKRNDLSERKQGEAPAKGQETNIMVSAKLEKEANRKLAMSVPQCTYCIK